MSKRYVLMHRQWWNRANGYTVNSLRVFDAQTGEVVTAPRFTGAPSLGSIYARAEELIGHSIETAAAMVDSVQVGSKRDLHNS